MDGDLSVRVSRLLGQRELKHAVFIACVCLAFVDFLGKGKAAILPAVESFTANYRFAGFLLRFPLDFRRDADSKKTNSMRGTSGR
jgi:hypothetical protein